MSIQPLLLEAKELQILSGLPSTDATDNVLSDIGMTVPLKSLILDDKELQNLSGLPIDEAIEPPDLEDRADAYTTAVGAYRTWNTRVNLDPPSSYRKPVPSDDKHIDRYYDALQYTLYETGYPETIDRSATPRRTYTRNDPTIVILSSPVECMCFLLEGGRQCPGDLILVLSTTWLSKVPSTEHGKEEAYELYVNKGISSDRGGNTFIDTYDPPRRVTYFVDFFTEGCTSGQRCDGEEIERHLVCPMSSSAELSKLVDDKLLTRILMGKAGLPYPTTLAFPYRSKMTYDTSTLEDITVFPLSTTTGVTNILSAAITKFLLSSEMENRQKVVVKPSGPMWFESHHVSIHPRNETESIVGAAAAILPHLVEGDAILVEAFLEPIPREHLRSNNTATRNKKKKENLNARKLSFRLRATVCRNAQGKALMTSTTCGVGDADRPISGDNTVVQNLEATLKLWGVTDAGVCQDVHDDVKYKSEATLDAIMEFEKTVSQSKRGPIGAQTDLIGIDFVLTKQEGPLSVVAVDVNSHDCTINNQIFEFINPEMSGEAVRPVVYNMLNRSIKYIMQGKRVLVIGGGGESKRFIWEAAQEYNIEVYLVESDPTHFAAEMVRELLHVDITDHTRDSHHANVIANMVKTRHLDLDGCLTFWEDCGPLAAMVAEELSLQGAGVQGAINAKSKSLTQKVLSNKKDDVPHWPFSYLYSSKSCRIESHTDIQNAVHFVDFPAIMKLDFGSSAVGVSKMQNVAQCHEFFDQVQQDLKTEEDHPGIGLGHGNAMILMDFIEGTEHDVDIIIYQRKLIAAFVSDNGPTGFPEFTETSGSMPTNLMKCKENQLIKAAYQCCIEIGLENGTFNVEMKMTPTGPKLIEVNGRMGGFYLRDWIKTCYNVDILLCSFAVACGVKPQAIKTEPTCHIMGLMLTPTHHGDALTPHNLTLLQKLHDDGVIHMNRFESSVQKEEYEEPYCNIAVVAPDRNSARFRLLETCRFLGVRSDSIPLSDFFDIFCT